MLRFTKICRAWLNSEEEVLSEKERIKFVEKRERVCYAIIVTNAHTLFVISFPDGIYPLHRK